MVLFEAELLIGGQIPPPKIIEDHRSLVKIYRYIRAGGWRPQHILNNFYMRDDSPVLAFKAMYNQIDKPKAVQFLIDHKDIRIIHLKRENLLKQYVSKALLGKRRELRWQPHTTHKVPIITTTISPEAAIREMRRVQSEYDKFDSLFVKHQKVNLVYESMIEKGCLTQQATNKICQLLDITPMPLRCDFVKMNPNHLEQMVENYAELADEISRTEFAHLLD